MSEPSTDPRPPDTDTDRVEALKAKWGDLFYIAVCFNCDREYHWADGPCCVVADDDY